MIEAIFRGYESLPDIVVNTYANELRNESTAFITCWKWVTLTSSIDHKQATIARKFKVCRCCITGHLINISFMERKSHYMDSEPAVGGAEYMTDVGSKQYDLNDPKSIEDMESCITQFLKGHKNEVLRD